MRIISGKFRGRRFHPPTSLPVRPTTDRAKEGLFNILQSRWDPEGMKVLDLFAGTGSISLEFISRGAAEVVAVDLNSGCIAFIKRTAEELKIDNLRALTANAYSFLERSEQSWDIIFADPPYADLTIEDLHKLVFTRSLLHYDGVLVIEHDRSVDFSQKTYYQDTRKYSKVHFSFFEYVS